MTIDEIFSDYSLTEDQITHFYAWVPKTVLKGIVIYDPTKQYSQKEINMIRRVLNGLFRIKDNRESFNAEEAYDRAMGILG